MSTTQEIIAAAENANLSQLFENSYPDLFTDECEDVERLLYWDLDEKCFGLKDDEQGSYRRAFEQQNNVVAIGYVDVNSAITREVSEFVEMWIAQRED